VFTADVLHTEQVDPVVLRRHLPGERERHLNRGVSEAGAGGEAGDECVLDGLDGAGPASHQAT
jgi:hypothetical protein